MTKGIIMAGGTGTRLHPMTLSLSKHLLPVYDKPMIYYPLSTLMLAGIRDILIITTPQALPLYHKILHDGSQWGISLSYVEQHVPDGIANAFILGDKFIGQDKVVLILGDNIFYGQGLSQELWHIVARDDDGATIFGYYVNNPERYGVITFDANKNPISIIEKPKNPNSNYAVTGLYFYDNKVIDIAKSLKPSARGELEITDVNNAYLEMGELHAETFGRGFAWLDMGTPASLLAAAQFMETIEVRQGLKIGCPEEVAWRRGYISDNDLLSLAEAFDNNSYGQYLNKIIERRKCHESA